VRAHRFFRGARLGAAAFAVTVATAATLAPVASASADDHGDGHGSYLALGDSVAFGYIPPQAVPAPNYADARSFVGYPEDLAALLDEHVANASCPGETTASLLYAGAPSNGCENSPVSSQGYRTAYPLHVAYSGTQIAYALAYLHAHPRTNLVTIDIGANDLFLCQETTLDGCTSTAEVTALLTTVETNLATIYTDLRAAGYQGRLVALTYYSLTYTSPAAEASTELFDSAIAAVTQKFGGVVADGFAAFQAPSARFGGDPCAAGLLVKLPDGSCNIHPSARGHWLLALAIARALGTGHRDD